MRFTKCGKMVMTMTNREKLQENYEDALFALMMDDFAHQEGERLMRENEALKENPAAAIPEDVTRRCLQTIRWELFRRKHRMSVKGIGRALGRLAIAAALVVALFTTAFAASPDFRASTLNMLLTFNEKAATWQFFSSGGSAFDIDSEESPRVNIGQLPEGYGISSIKQDPFRTTIIYNNPAGAKIDLTALRAENSTLNVDIENPDYYEQTTIHGYTAIVVDKLGLARITWAEEDMGLIICMDATDMSVAELKGLADNIVFD